MHFGAYFRLCCGRKCFWQGRLKSSKFMQQPRWSYLQQFNYVCSTLGCKCQTTYTDIIYQIKFSCTPTYEKKHQNCLKMFRITSTQCCQELKLNIGEAAWKKRRSCLKWWAQLRDVPLPKIHEVFFSTRQPTNVFFSPRLGGLMGIWKGENMPNRFDECQ